MTDSRLIMEDYDAGYEAGKAFAQKKVVELMNEVIDTYDKLSEQREGDNKWDQVNAAKFVKSWVMSGGHTDFDGNRVCLPW